MNGGSIDNSINLIKKNAMNNNHIQIINQSIRGISVARNSGVK